MGWKNAGKGLLTGAGAGASFGPVGAGIGAGLGALTGIFGEDEQDPADIYNGVNVPSVEELIRAGQVDPSAFEGIQEDPRLKQAQLDALGYLQNVGREQGMDLESKVALREAMDTTAQRDRASRGAVLEQMAQRGQSNGGAQLAAQLAGQQQSATANANAGARAAADARSRALAAMAQSGQMAGQVRGQDWSNASDRAQAHDRINQFNSQNRRSAYGENFAGQMAKANGQAGAAQAGQQQGAANAYALGKLGGGGYDAYQRAEEEKRKKAAEAGGSPWSMPTRID